MNRVYQNVNFLFVMMFLLPSCTILGIGTVREKQVEGIGLFASANQIKGLKPHQICNLSNDISRPAVQNFTTNSIRNIVQNTKDSVVNIYVKTSTPIRVHILMIPVPGIPSVHIPGKALGSGFICSSNGFILSNSHVVSRAKELIAKNSQGEEFPLEILAIDQEADLALLKIKKLGNYSSVNMVNSARLSEGDMVVAIGNPLGLNHSVSHGIISQRSRHLDEELVGKNKFPAFLQSDTPINPGNSGGPLIDMSGQVIGINTAIIQGAQGISFTVPTERIRQFLNEVGIQSNENIAQVPRK